MEAYCVSNGCQKKRRQTVLIYICIQEFRTIWGKAKVEKENERKTKTGTFNVKRKPSQVDVLENTRVFHC